MNKFLVLFFSITLFSCQSTHKTILSDKNSISILSNTSQKQKRIVFLGNSITYAGQYITDIEMYFLTHYPERRLEFINVGLPSETVSGLSEEGHAGGAFPRPDLHERLERVLDQTKPDLVFACYGMNDGIYQPFDKDRFRKFKEGIYWLREQVERSDSKIIHITPPVYDELKGKKSGYESVLQQYSSWLVRQADSLHWEVIDTHSPMKKYLEDRRRKDSAFALANDGVHPGAVGHWLIAKQVLLYLGANDVNDIDDPVALWNSKPADEELYKLVARRHGVMKDAWLSATKHQRPGMKSGIPLDEALRESGEIEKEIRDLVVQRQRKSNPR